MSFTSVIVPAYNQTRLSAHITMAALANITKYTDTDDYELILIEDIPKYAVRDDYKVLKIDRHIILDEYTNYSTKMNMAASEAKGDYLCFIQNDVFVWEGWLKTVQYFFDNKMAECLMPDQLPSSRQYILNTYQIPIHKGVDGGAREACAIFITKEAFVRSGGFNEDIQAFVESDYYGRLSDAGIALHCTNKIQVTHITLATHYQDMEAFDRKMTRDSLILNHGASPGDLGEFIG